MKKKTERIILGLLWGLFAATAAVALVWMAWGIADILHSPFTSFPWWAACAFTGLYFGPPLLLELAAALGFTFFRCRALRRQEGEGRPSRRDG
ncbi:MAG: hypothetical protein MR014_00965 [Oscillospiraceae bacterium]|nr:hypothetical protein [Oscillospiraceae bacterium]